MDFTPSLPIPISFISGSYFLFSIDDVTYLRREHHICGVLIGTLPQIPQQNVFLGLPLQLMPEEARLLVEKGVAYIVDEAKAQRDGMKALMEADRQRYLQDLESQGLQASRLQATRREQQREEVLKKMEKKKATKVKKDSEQKQQPVPAHTDDAPSDLEMFASSPQPAATPSGEGQSSQASVPPSYPLFTHLHSQGYYLSPGLRFGCQYLAYPGDPLRFHSHFLVASAEWDEEIKLMDVVSGGRLGTGVKKGFLLGGVEKNAEKSQAEGQDTIRTFSIEWAGM
ncbi:hypothetical protein ASPZODRAFT_56983 [Penicilliopsis zonata CBS 506.65]|uniref:tRNA-splicing endonuclease subunit Sen34 n=1 Tax=Penicilliopsis zonata CBS 506.65 TaxID=1073090 RepID=A0A1L9SUF8_9EURO|nr:hypothetical protein ASPZODRAFT_56983 [Penicilliopsis zonata CBS 506.65]OJJ50855.1 hypothetical protein ASPZODRAFT_56983 [Penicilliopsis zonata CBS 506.65]